MVSFNFNSENRPPSFGHDTLYVTSLGGDVTEGTHQPNAGGLFALKVPGVTGVELPRMTLA